MSSRSGNVTPSSVAAMSNRHERICVSAFPPVNHFAISGGCACPAALWRPLANHYESRGSRRGAKACSVESLWILFRHLKGAKASGVKQVFFSYVRPSLKRMESELSNESFSCITPRVIFAISLVWKEAFRSIKQSVSHSLVGGVKRQCPRGKHFGSSSADWITSSA